MRVRTQNLVRLTVWYANIAHTPLRATIILTIWKRTENEIESAAAEVIEFKQKKDTLALH